MSSAADIVKRLQSLQKCLSELQNQNKELKDYNHRLVEEKNGLLEKIAVLEAQSSSSTEPKIVVSASLNAAESGLIQKEPDTQKNKKKSNHLLAQGIVIPKKLKSEESQQPALKPLAKQFLGGPSKIFSIPSLQPSYPVPILASEPQVTSAALPITNEKSLKDSNRILATKIDSQAQPSPVELKKRLQQQKQHPPPPARKETIDTKPLRIIPLPSSSSSSSGPSTASVATPLIKSDPVPIIQPIILSENGWKHFTPTVQKSTESSAKRSSKPIDNSGGKEQALAVLTGLTQQNFHSIAFHISKLGMKPPIIARAIQQRINQHCTRTIRVDNITSLSMSDDSNDIASVLLPSLLMVEIDLLVSCCNSILTRTNNAGVSFIKQLMDHFQALAFACIHALSNTPIFTIATGHVNERQMSLPRSADVDGTKQEVAHIWSMDIDAEDEEDQKELMEVEDEEDGVDKMDGKNPASHVGEDSRIGDSEDRGGYHCSLGGEDDESVASSSTASSISATEFLSLLQDKSQTSQQPSPPLQQQKEALEPVMDPPRVYQLQLSGYIYFLLSFYARSGWASAAMNAIRAMALITTHLPAIGVVLGVGQVVVLYRHLVLTTHTSILDMSQILNQWTSELPLKHRKFPQGFINAEVRSLTCILGKVIQLFKEVAPPAPSLFLASLTHRQKGLWKAVEEAPFDVIGLSCCKALAVQAQEVLNLSRRSAVTKSTIDSLHTDLATFSGMFLSLSAVAPSATSEEDIITHYASSWKVALSGSKSSFRYNEFLSALQALSALFYAFLHAEYAMGGWTVDSGYDAVTLFSKVKRRTVQFHTAASANPKIKTLFPAMVSSLSATFYAQRISGDVALTHYSSIESDEIKSAILLLDKWINVIHQEGNLLSMSERDDSVPVELQLKVDKVAVEALEISATLTFAVLEIILFLTACSLRGMLRTLSEFIRERKENATTIDSSNHNVDKVNLMDRYEEGLLMSSLIDLLCQLPSPWGPHARADMQHELLLAKKCQYLHSAVVPIPRKFPLSEAEMRFSRWRVNLQSRVPAFVINLDRRSDRWRRVTMMAERSGLAAIRVSAVDGSRLAEAKVAAGGDSYTLSEKDVVTHWNSTFNAKFDRKCHPDLNTPMTLSERACAASHLKVWRMIQEIHQEAKKKQQTKKRKSSTQGKEVEGERPGSGWVDMLGNVWATRRRDFFLVFEDDASIFSASAFEFRQELDTILTHIPQDMDILYLGYIIPTGEKVKRMKVGGVTFSKIRYAWQLHAYVITSSAAEKLINNLPISAPVDNYIATLIYDGVLTAYAVERRIVVQHGGGYQNRSVDSDIRHSGRL